MGFGQLPPAFAWTGSNDPEDLYLALRFQGELIGTIRWDDSHNEYVVLAVIDGGFFIEFYDTVDAAVEGLENEAVSRLPWID